MVNEPVMERLEVVLWKEEIIDELELLSRILGGSEIIEEGSEIIEEGSEIIEVSGERIGDRGLSESEKTAEFGTGISWAEARLLWPDEVLIFVHNKKLAERIPSCKSGTMFFFSTTLE